MKTWHVNKPDTRLPGNLYRAGTDYFAGSRSDSEILICFTVHLTGFAAYAACIIMGQRILAHFLPPFGATGLTVITVSVMAHPPPAGSKS
jgi:hypothetical protein